MSRADNSLPWWALHLRVARGETLTPDEQRLYDEEMARQDRDAPPLKTDRQALKLLRDQVIRLASDNTELRTRLSRLEEERQRVERSLSAETRQLLGVGD